MRKIVALIIALLAALCFACSDATSDGETPVIERVVMFAVDGAGDYWKDASTPRIDSIFA